MNDAEAYLSLMKFYFIRLFYYNRIMVVIKTEKFILRSYRKGDEESLAKNIYDKTIARSTLRIPYPYTLKDAKEWVRKNLKENRKKKPDEINFVVDINGEVAGGIGLSEIKDYQAEIGFWVASKYRNKGITTLALKKVTKFGFEKIKLRRIYACVFPFNKASMRVLKKNGYKLEGILRKEIKKGNKLLDNYLFAKVK